MAEYDAIVKPLQDWGTDGKADVWILGGLNLHTILDLENRKTSTDTNVLKRSEYIPGLIRINKDHLPSGETITLKVEITIKKSISHQDWPHGGVLFV